MPFHPLDRRTFLRAAGVSIALPFLDAMAHGQQPAAARPKRMVLIGRPLGFHAPYFFPDNAGREYRHSRYTQLLNAHKEHFTVFSGMSHRGYPGGHHIEVALFTGVAPEGVRSGNEIRNTISLDQEAAGRLGGETRFASLVLGGGDLAWNRRGVRIPSQARATQVFRQMFVRGTPAEIARETRRIQDGQSILDDVRDQARAINAHLGAADRDRMDLFLNSIREAEQRLQQDEAWANRPRPQVSYTPPTDDFLVSRLLERTRQWYDIVHLALQTDSTRIVLLYLWSHERPTLDGITMAHHDASHHGQDDAKIRQLALIEEAEIRLFGDFINKLKTSNEGQQSVLDRTAVLYASNLGNASSHTCDNLPIVLAGGGFRHQGHVVYDRRNNTPLSNLFVRMLQQTGIEARSFGSSTGVLGEV
jgi:hypothetical protein